MHAFKDKVVGLINRVQTVGAEAIIGTFLTVATCVAEAEAHVTIAQSRFWRRAVKLWMDIHTLRYPKPTRFAGIRLVSGNSEDTIARICIR